MGTSTSQRSPDTPNWRLAWATLGREDISPGVQLSELWKAVSADRGDELYERLASTLMATANKISFEENSPTAAARQFDAVSAETGQMGPEVDLCRRALLRSVITSDPNTDFGRELFSEIVGYYVARDLPSFVASPDRVPSASKAIELKNAISQATKEVVSGAGKAPADVRGWQEFVRNALARLGRSGR